MLARHPLLIASLLCLGAGALQPGLAAARSVEGWRQSGLATWYGAHHAGRRTSSGEAFNPALMTAAHPSLPLGSYVRVTVQESGRAIVVRVNDREPAHGARCIDLSEGAAARLGIVNRGRAMVTLDKLDPDEGQSEMAQSRAAETEIAEAPDDAVNAADLAEAGASVRHGRRHRRHAPR